MFDFCEQKLFWRSDFSVLKSALRLLKVTFDVNVPERLTHSPSLSSRAPVLRFRGGLRTRSFKCARRAGRDTAVEDHRGPSTVSVVLLEDRICPRS